MFKKKGWMCLIKRLFFSETHQQQQHKGKRRRWLFGRIKRTKGLPSPAAEAASVSPKPSTIEIAKVVVEERLNKHEEDVRKSMSKCEVEECKAEDVTTNEAYVSELNFQQENHVESLAATKIQIAYRGYLARKALRALKGFVTLQAIIRGLAVRRQAVTTLKCLQSVVNIQSEVCARRRQMSQGNSRDLQLQDFGHEKRKIQLNRGKPYDDGLLSKDEEIDIILRKKDAILRRQRIKAHSFNHRHSADSEERNAEGRLRYWLEQYVSDQLPKKDENSDGKHPKSRNVEGLNRSDVISLPRRSFHNHTKQSSYTDDSLQQSSPTHLPTYMAATKSAKAKTRSLSSPRLRPIHVDAYSDSDSPYKNKASPMSSINSEVTSSSISKVSNKSCYSYLQQKSPSLKGKSGLVRSNRNLKDIRLDHESLLATSRKIVFG